MAVLQWGVQGPEPREVVRRETPGQKRERENREPVRKEQSEDGETRVMGVWTRRAEEWTWG